MAQFQEKLQSLPGTNGHVIVPVLNFRLKLRTDDLGLTKDLVLSGVREREAVDFLRPMLHGFRTVVEIGANQGYYAILEALETAPEAKIYAFEPHPDNIRTLRLNIELNECGAKFAEVIQAAVSDRSGTSELNIHALSNWHSLNRIALPKGGWKSALSVDTVTLDDFCRSRNIEMVDFVRMDVEGHEAAVVDGATQVLSVSRDCVVFIELHSALLRQVGRSSEAMVERLKTLGFRRVTTCGKGRQPYSTNMDDFGRNLELITEEHGNHIFFFKE
jgi:FkbM family methyltransferase